MLRFDRIGQALEHLMARRSLNQRQLAERAEMSPAQLNKYVRGAKLPNLETLERLLRAMSFDLHDLADAFDAVDEGEELAPEPHVRASAEALRRASSSGGRVRGTFIEGVEFDELLMHLERLARKAVEAAERRRERRGVGGGASRAAEESRAGEESRVSEEPGSGEDSGAGQESGAGEPGGSGSG